MAAAGSDSSQSSSDRSHTLASNTLLVPNRTTGLNQIWKSPLALPLPISRRSQSGYLPRPDHS